MLASVRDKQIIRSSNLLIHLPSLEFVTLPQRFDLERRFPARFLARTSHSHPSVSDQDIGKQSCHFTLSLFRREKGIGRQRQEICDLFVQE